MMKAIWALLAASAFTLATVGSSEAIGVNCTDPNNNLNTECAGELTTTSNSVILTLTNNSPADTGGSGVSIGINIPGDGLGGLTLDTTNSVGPTGWSVDEPAQSLSFEVGFSLDNNGDKDTLGWNPGDTYTWTWVFTGGTVPSADSIANAITNGTNCDNVQAWGCIHVISLGGDGPDLGSEKVPLARGENGVPEPSTLLFLGLGLVGLGAAARRKLR